MIVPFPWASYAVIAIFDFSELHFSSISCTIIGAYMSFNKYVLYKHLITVAMCLIYFSNAQLQDFM